MKDKKTAETSGTRRRSGQSLPMVMILAGVFGIFASTMVSLFRFEVKSQVRTTCMLEKQELASIALEHAIFKLQQGDNWYHVGTGIEGFYGYATTHTSSLGKYAVHIAPGNLFMSNLADPFSRQAQQESMTIGIKIQVAPDDLKCIASYYAVVERKTLGGPIVSAGKIDLPCTNAKISDSNLYWGDIFSANTNNGYCRTPHTDTSKSNPPLTRMPWLPKVYSASDIYTCNGNTGGRTGTYTFGTTFDDMSPTAHAHPFSAYATFPEIDLDYYRGLASASRSYYGPPNIAGSGPNPGGINKFYVSDGKHDNDPKLASNFVIQANAVTLMAKLRNVSDVLFIDTTDGLPLRASPCNSYSYCVTVTPNTATDKTIRFYVDNNNQYFTSGRIFVMGPLQLIGHLPSNIANTWGYSWTYGYNTATAGADEIWNVRQPDNYYYPQTSDGAHYVMNSADQSRSHLYDVKHSGFIYTAGELKLGGPRSGATTVSNICIYGTILLGPLGILLMDTTNDNPLLYLYYNKDVNVFGMQGSTISLVSFSEISFLIPTPEASPFY